MRAESHASISLSGMFSATNDRVFDFMELSISRDGITTPPAEYRMPGDAGEVDQRRRTYQNFLDQCCLSTLAMVKNSRYLLEA